MFQSDSLELNNLVNIARENKLPDQYHVEIISCDRHFQHIFSQPHNVARFHDLIPFV